MALRIAIAEETDNRQARLESLAVSDPEMLSAVDVRCIQQPRSIHASGLNSVATVRPATCLAAS